MQRAVVKLERDHRRAGALVVHDQVDSEELMKNSAAWRSDCHTSV